MVIRILFLLLLSSQAYGQNVFRIHFTDKNNSPYSISQPQNFLSQKSIDRRNRYSINLDSHDLPISPIYIDSILQYPNVFLKAKSKWMNCITIETDSTTLNLILAVSFVQDAERLKSSEIISTNEKMDVERLKRFNIFSENYYGSAYDQIEIHNGQLLHEQGFRGKGMTIAILDAGFPLVNEMTAYSKLYSENRILGTYNFLNDQPDVYTNTHIHGSLVLSCMGAELPYEQVGTAPDANYYLFVTEDANIEMPIEEDNWVEAAELADSLGVDMINSSLGYTTFDDATLNHTYSELDGNTTFITRGADFAASRGILIFVSAGNNGTSSWFHIGAPGDADSVMTVAAVGKDRLYAEFSSKGPAADGDVKPDIAAQGYLSAVIWPGGDVSFGSGTSFSSPISCGMAACLWQAHPEKSNMEIINAIHVSSSHFFAPDSLTGFGIPDFYLAHELLSGSQENDEGFILENVFPNPFSSELYLDVFSGNQTEMTVRIYSITGEMIYKETVNLKAEMKNRISLTRNFEKLSTGMYFVRVRSGNHLETRKINYIHP